MYETKAKPKGSIIQAWVAYQALTIFGMYLKDVETTFNRPPRNNDGGLRKEKLLVLAQIARPFGDPICGKPFSKKNVEVAHWFVLNNYDETLSYLDKHENMMKQTHPSHFHAKKHRELFPQWFLEYVSLKCFVLDIYIVPIKLLELINLNVCLILGESTESIEFPRVQ